MARERILIVDDEALIRHSLADYLAEFGYLTETARNGAEGLAKARTGRYDVVLVDLRMPHIDGLEILHTLKQEQPELPLIVVSGTGVPGDAIEAMRRGAWDYIVKPIQDLKEMVVVIERVLERVRLKAERDRYQRELEQLNNTLQAEISRQTQDLRMHNRELAALNSLSHAISSSLEMSTMLGRGVATATEALGADSGLVRLLNREKGELIAVAMQGLPQSFLLSARSIPLDQGVVGRVARDGAPYAGTGLPKDPWWEALSPDPGPRSYLCVPLRTGDETLGTLEMFSRDPHSFDTRKTDLLVTIGNQIGVAIERAQYRADLEKANFQLEHALAELKRLDSTRDQIIQNVSHELRTPLTLVSGYLELMIEGGLGPDGLQNALEVAFLGAKRLSELVESITTLQDFHDQPLDVELIAPRELVQTAIRMITQRAVTSGVELHSRLPEDLDPVPGDFARLAQALHHLLDNACKFSPSGSRVLVSAGVQSDMLCISVADQGIGIPPGEQKQIFERFYQIDGSTTRRYGGTGLGLAIVREIVRAHGGEVLVESSGEPGRGSTFTLQLPLQRS